MTERVGLARWQMRGLLLFVLAFANLNDIWSPDVLPNALFAWTVVREGDLDYDEFVFRPAERDPLAGTSGTEGTLANKLDSEAYFFRACGESTATEPPQTARSPGGPPAPGPYDRVCSIFPPGVAFLAFPFFLPFVLAGTEPLNLGLLVRVGHVAAAAIEVVAALLLWSVMRRFTNARWALALVLLYFLGTSVRTVASQALWQHAGVHLAVALALWLVLISRPVAAWREVGAGLALGLGAVVRQTTALVVPFAPAGRVRATIYAFVGAAIGVTPLLAYNVVAFGNPFEQGYGTKPFDTSPLVGLYGLLLSPSRGLFVYEPYMLFAIAAVVALKPERDLIEQRLLSLAYAWAATAILYATYAEWWGGRVFGPRFLDDLAPVLFVLLAWGIGHGLLARAVVRTAFWICAAWSLVIFQAAAFVYDQNTWDLHPTNINVDPSRLLDWSTDPQWLFVLRSVPDGGERVIVAAGLSVLALLFLLRVESVLPSRR
ncbi:MAG TPA: hypothetical protein VMQ78_08640 [Candidatus Limnocylindria bacterium]|nr:hypothetical protein [Candidatus Limnocylindria bacterium]